MTDRLLPGDPPTIDQALTDFEVARLDLDLDPTDPAALAAYTEAGTWLIGSAASPPSCSCPPAEATRVLGVAGLLIIDLAGGPRVTARQLDDVGATLGAIVGAIEALNTETGA